MCCTYPKCDCEVFNATQKAKNLPSAIFCLALSDPVWQVKEIAIVQLRAILTCQRPSETGSTHISVLPKWGSLCYLTYLLRSPWHCSFSLQSELQHHGLHVLQLSQSSSAPPAELNQLHRHRWKPKGWRPNRRKLPHSNWWNKSRRVTWEHSIEQKPWGWYQEMLKRTKRKCPHLHFSLPRCIVESPRYECWDWQVCMLPLPWRNEGHSQLWCLKKLAKPKPRPGQFCTRKCHRSQKSPESSTRCRVPKDSRSVDPEKKSKTRPSKYSHRSSLTSCCPAKSALSPVFWGSAQRRKLYQPPKDRPWRGLSSSWYDDLAIASHSKPILAPIFELPSSRDSPAQFGWQVAVDSFKFRTWKLEALG